MRPEKTNGLARAAQTAQEPHRCIVRLRCYGAVHGICNADRPPTGEHMTTFDDRERGFEKKFELDQEQEFKAGARRNRMLGEWAAGLMGLSADSVTEYAKAVVKSDFELPGDEDVLRKVFEDLKGSGVAVSEGEVRMKMDELLAQAREQLRSGE